MLGNHFEEKHRAQLVFVNCATESFQYGDENDHRDFNHCLSNILFDRSVPLVARGRYHLSCLGVLERINAGSTLVILQVNECSKNPGM